MENFFRGFEKKAGFGEKVMKGIKALNPLKVKHDLSPEAKKYLEEQAKKMSEAMAKKTKHLPAKIFGGSALVGSGATVGKRFTEKLLEPEGGTKSTRKKR